VQRLGKVAFETKTVKLYSQILEYQIRLAYQYSRHTLSRYFRDVVLADDWKAMLAEVKDFEQSIIKDLREVDGYTMKVVDEKTSESLGLQIRLRAKIEARHHLRSPLLYYTHYIPSLLSRARALLNRKDIWISCLALKVPRSILEGLSMSDDVYRIRGLVSST
jgi:hypothetical protein